MQIVINNRTTYPCKVTVTRDGTLSSSLPLAANGHAHMRTSQLYTVIGYTTMEDGNTVVSAPVHFSASSHDIIAEILLQDGAYVFRLVVSAGTHPDELTLYNHTKCPVSFDISMDHTPLRLVTVVNKQAHRAVSTREVYNFSAHVYGVTTATITTSNPEAHVEVYEAGEDLGSFASYGVRFIS
jgi:hypothetical protein